MENYRKREDLLKDLKNTVANIGDNGAIAITSGQYKYYYSSVGMYAFGILDPDYKIWFQNRLGYIKLGSTRKEVERAYRHMTRMEDMDLAYRCNHLLIVSFLTENDKVVEIMVYPTG